VQGLRWITFGHLEADECGGMNNLLAAAPQAEVAHGGLGCMVSLNDLADRAPVPLADGQVIELGPHRRGHRRPGRRLRPTPGRGPLAPAARSGLAEFVGGACQTRSVIEHKDVVISLLGASAGLTGLVLIFLGSLVAAIGALPPGSDAAVYRPYRLTALVVAVAFGLGLCTVALSTAWLLSLDDTHGLYVGTAVLFIAQLVAIAATAAIAVRLLVWGT
jgi:hypothetical protein